MTLIIPAGYAQFVLHWQSPNFDTGNAVTTFGMGAALGPDPASLEEAVTAVAAAVGEHILPLMDNTTVLASAECYNADDGATIVLNDPGGTNIVAASPNVACLVTKVCPGRGRRRQGRMFWPSILAQTIVAETGLINLTNLNAIQAAFDAFQANLEIALPEAGFVILQNDDGNTPPISPPPVVTGFKVEQRVASQRRRLRR
jgi:hypothetical protein